MKKFIRKTKNVTCRVHKVTKQDIWKENEERSVEKDRENKRNEDERESEQWQRHPHRSHDISV